MKFQKQRIAYGVVDPERIVDGADCGVVEIFGAPASPVRWIASITVDVAPRDEAKARTAALVASGGDAAFSVTSAMIPSVPSLPTKRWVKEVTSRRKICAPGALS